MNAPLPVWTPRPRPERVTLKGQYVRLMPLMLDHALDLHQEFSEDTTGRIWDWMSVGPFASPLDYQSWAETAEKSSDPLFFSVFDLDNVPQTPRGIMSLMRIDPSNGVIEVGNIIFAPRLQRTRATTEAQYLIAQYVFETLGYRRLEWKCNVLNAPSRATALRLGFVFEGIFRNHMVIKGRNRDTAWYAMTDADWERVRPGFERWLDPGNFDAQNQQKSRLSL